MGVKVALKEVGALLGDRVGSFIGTSVGSEVGEDAAGADVGHSFATLISTSAQFQNWRTKKIMYNMDILCCEAN